MALTTIYTNLTGEIGVNPRPVLINTTATLSQAAVAGFLNPEQNAVNNLSALDAVTLLASDGIAYGGLSLTTDGTITFTPSIQGGSNVTAGSNGVAGVFKTYPSAQNTGYLEVAGVANSGNYATILSNAPQGQATTYSIPDAGAASANLLVSTMASGQSITVPTASAAPGAVRALTGKMSLSAAVYSNGSNSVAGLRGEVDMVGASAGFIYGVQGKVIPTGTISGSVWVPAVFGQFDLSATTITGGTIAPLWGDMGATATSGTYTGLYGIAMTNTTAAIAHAQVYLYGGATYFANLVDNNGLVGATYIKTPAGATPSGTLRTLDVNVNGTALKILCAGTYS